MIKRKISLVAWILVIGFVATQLFVGTALGDDYGSPILKLTEPLPNLISNLKIAKNVS